MSKQTNPELEITFLSSIAWYSLPKNKKFLDQSMTPQLLDHIIKQVSYKPGSGLLAKYDPQRGYVIAAWILSLDSLKGNIDVKVDVLNESQCLNYDNIPLHFRLTSSSKFFRKRKIHPSEFQIVSENHALVFAKFLVPDKEVPKVFDFIEMLRSIWLYFETHECDEFFRIGGTVWDDPHYLARHNSFKRQKLNRDVLTYSRAAWQGANWV